MGDLAFEGGEALVHGEEYSTRSGARHLDPHAFPVPGPRTALMPRSAGRFTGSILY